MPFDNEAPDMERMAGSVETASQLLKAIASPLRLMILCALSQGETPVGELAARLGQRQATISQHLARLRQEGLVSARREGQSVRYAIADETAAEIVATLYRRFCGAGADAG